MKTERRHALETNTLASELATWSEKVRPYTGGILTGLAVILGLYAALSWWNSHGANREAVAWDKYERALLQGDPSFAAVYEVASNEQYAGARAPEWAYVAWADRQLRLAANNFLIDRNAAKDQLNEIEAVYEQFATQADEAEVRNRARFGLARVNEMQGRFDEAREHYAQVEGALMNVAQDRLKDLEDNEASITEASSWLATADLPTPAPPPGGGGLPGARPGFDAPPPTTEGAATPFDDSDAIDDFLGGFGDDEAAGGRYGEEGATAPAEGATPDSTTTTPEATEEPAAEPPADAAPSETPPADASSAPESSADATTAPAADAATEPATDAATEPAADGSTPAQQ